jgi:hypothetical protein
MAVMRRLSFVAISLAGALAGSTGCAQILGDFTIGDAPDAGGGKDSTTDHSTDVEVADAPNLPDTSPTCGALNQQCCPNPPPCIGQAICCGPTCVDTQQDPNNCGTCGKRCQTSCNNGVCAPTLVTTVLEKDPGPLHLYQNSLYAGIIGFGAGSVLVCDLQAKCQMFKPAIQGGVQNLFDIAVAPNHIYASDVKDGLIIDQVMGGSVSQNAVGTPTGLDVGNGYMFAMLQTTPYQITPWSSSFALNAGNGEGGTDIAIAGQSPYVYWTTSYEIHVGKVKYQSSESVYFSKFGSDAPLTIAANTSWVAWASADGGGTFNVWSCAVGLNCSNANRLGSKQTVGLHPGNIAIDGNNVYWTGHDNSRVFVSRCDASTTCNSPTIVAQVQTKGMPFAGGVTFDGVSIYFLVGDDNGTTLYQADK